MKNTTARPITKQIAVTAILLAICIASQFLKNLSVYVTGPIVNLCLIVAAMSVGPVWGIILAVITPVTAFLIAASPVMTAVPGIIPLIMLGNAVFVLFVYFLFRPAVSQDKPLVSVRSVLTALISCAAKGVIMGLTISLWLLPTFLPAESSLYAGMPVFQTTFSLTQFITAVIGFVYFFIVWKALSRSLSKGN